MNSHPLQSFKTYPPNANFPKKIVLLEVLIRGKGRAYSGGGYEGGGGDGSFTNLMKRSRQK